MKKELECSNVMQDTKGETNNSLKIMSKEIKTELLNWSRHNYPTLFYRHGAKIKTFIEGLDEKRITKAKGLLQQYLIQLNNGK